MVRWLSVVLLLLWVGARGAVAETDPRQDLLLRLNQERFRSGLPPLRLVPALSLAAQEHAEEIGRRSSRPEPEGTRHGGEGQGERGNGINRP
ncbi:MAG TPA: CAP domain-containing protein [Thermoanaerobaculia bacterium]|nr:CAP domain-containing protein [Thermoanaerobaculia bacterium]